MTRSLPAIAFFGIVTSLALPAWAQEVAPTPPADHAHGGRGEGQRLISALGLDATQAAQVRQVFVDTRGDRERIHAMPRGSAEQIAAREQLEQQVHTRIDAVLTDAQRARFAELRAQHHGRHGGMGRDGGHRGGGHRGGI